MKKIFLLVFCLIINPTVWGNKPSTQTPMNGETALKMLAQHPEKTISGPFLLGIKKVTQEKLNFHLHTANEADQNIIIEVPPFIQNNYKAKTLEDMKQVFVSHQVLVKGQLKAIKPDPKDLAQKDIKPDGVAKIKLIFFDQLSFYD